MELYQTKFNGYKINVIFTGSHYYFYSMYCGLVAVASRNYGINNDKDFTIDYGNDRLIGGSLGYSAPVPYIKRFISKCENRYVTSAVNYTVNNYTDLSRKHLSVSVL